MANFITRIELHGKPTDEDYKELHEAMEKKGFKRTVTSKGNAYHLPNAVYFSNDLSIANGKVMTRAKQAVAATDKKASIVVVEAANILASGLEPVKHVKLSNRPRATS